MDPYYQDPDCAAEYERFQDAFELAKEDLGEEAVFVLEDKSPTETWGLRRPHYLHMALVSALKTGWTYMRDTTPEQADSALRDYMISLLPPPLHLSG